RPGGRRRERHHDEKRGKRREKPEHVQCLLSDEPNIALWSGYRGLRTPYPGRFLQVTVTKDISGRTRNDKYCLDGKITKKSCTKHVHVIHKARPDATLPATCTSVHRPSPIPPIGCQDHVWGCLPTPPR